MYIAKHMNIRILIEMSSSRQRVHEQRIDGCQDDGYRGGGGGRWTPTMCPIAVEELAGCIFVQTVDCAVMTFVLIRGLDERSEAVKCDVKQVQIER